jgi:hypothetical protein
MPQILHRLISFKEKLNNDLDETNVVLINNIEALLVKEHALIINLDDYMKNKTNRRNFMYSVIV